MVIIHGPMVMAMDIQVGTIIMAITMVILSWNNYYGYNGWNYGYSLKMM